MAYCREFFYYPVDAYLAFQLNLQLVLDLV